MCKKCLGRKKGFALILTLSLISFVFLLVITLVNQVRLEFSFTDARQNQILARANARMGMMIAIGEIQKHLGPDMRVSATADIYDERVESLIPLTSDSYSQEEADKWMDSFDLNGNGRDDELPAGQRMWTGVWKDRGVGSSKNLEDDRMTNPLPFNGDDAISLTDSWDVDSTYDHHPAIEMAWLVSGNEGKKLALLDSRGKVTEHIEVPDGRPKTSEGRIIPIDAGQEYGTDENAWQDHKNLVLYNTKLDYHHPYLELSDPDENDSVTWLLNQPVTEEVHVRIKDVKSKGLFDVDSFRVKVRKTALHSDQKWIKIGKTEMGPMPFG